MVSASCIILRECLNCSGFYTDFITDSVTEIIHTHKKNMSRPQWCFIVYSSCNTVKNVVQLLTTFIILFTLIHIYMSIQVPVKRTPDKTSSVLSIVIISSLLYSSPTEIKRWRVPLTLFDNCCRWQWSSHYKIVLTFPW